jgi:Tfp pilus assembly protein PilO
MKRNDLTILLVLGVVGLIVAFWIVVIGPKRHEADSLKDDVDQLHSQLDQAQQAAAAGEQAHDDFSANYRRLVVLGKAVPPDSDQASLLVQLQRLADRADVRFQSIDLAESSASTSASPSTSSSPVPPVEPSTSGVAETTPTSAPPVPATEAAAATLPLGAAVGPAGLPVMPYELRFTGGFFQIANFLQNLDAMVHTRHSDVDVNGRLLTVDGFSLTPGESAGAPSEGAVPTLTADLSVTTYLTPADQGITAGATPGGPGPTTPAPATPTPASSTSVGSDTTTSASATSTATTATAP